MRRTRRSARDRLWLPVTVAVLLGLVALARALAALSVPWLVATLMLGGSAASVVVWATLRAVRQRQRQYLTRMRLAALDPGEFEERVLLLLEDLGWQQVRRVGGSGDRGVDLYGRRDGANAIVQCKRYRGLVSPDKVRELVGVLHIQQADCALLATTGYFSKQGYQEAQGYPVELWDGATLARLMEQVEAARAHPNALQRARQWAWIAAGILLLINAAALLWALLSPPI